MAQNYQNGLKKLKKSVPPCNSSGPVTQGDPGSDPGSDSGSDPGSDPGPADQATDPGTTDRPEGPNVREEGQAERESEEREEGQPEGEGGGRPTEHEGAPEVAVWLAGCETNFKLFLWRNQKTNSEQ